MAVDQTRPVAGVGKRVITVILAVVAIVCPFWFYELLRPGPDFRGGAMMWVVLMPASLAGSMLLAVITRALAKSTYDLLPQPRPLLRQLEYGVAMAPIPVLVASVVLWLVTR